MGQEDTADYWMERGDGFYNTLFAESAIKCYDQVLKLDPKNASAWYKKGVMLSSQYKQNESLAAFNIAINLSPEDPKVWISKGLGIYINEKLDEAVDDQLIDLNSEHKILNNMGGQIKILNGSVRYKEIWNYTFDVSPQIRRIAAALSADEDHSELALVFEDPSGVASEENADLGAGKIGPIQIISPKNGQWTLNVYGYNVPVEAPATFTIKLVNQPYSPERFESSLEALDEAIKLDPMSLNAMILKAKILTECGMLDEARETIENALKLDPSNSAAWSTRGEILMMDDEYEEAIKSINVSNELVNNYKDSWLVWEYYQYNIIFPPADEL